MKNQSVKLTYAAVGDYFIPNIALTEAASENIGKYGRMRKKYLREHRPGLYNRLVLSENLQDAGGGSHLVRVDLRINAQGGTVLAVPPLLICNASGI